MWLSAQITGFCHCLCHAVSSRVADFFQNGALEIESDDKSCLVARSKCHLKLGDAKAALKDAEAALADDPEFNNGLYQKAEALYQSGDFEMALVFYHRGNKLRPELQKFRLGIQKAQEAIDNSIGDIANVKLDNKGDLSEFYKQDESKTKKPPRIGYSKPSTKPQEDNKKRKQRKEQNEKQKEITKQLLGELYADKMYLDKLLKDQDLTRSDTDSGNRIYDLVSEGIDYLDTRTEFWRQQKPMYARKRDKIEGRKEQSTKAGGKKPVDPTRYILTSLEEIDAAMAEGQPKKAMKQAQKVLKMVEGWDEEDVPDKQELVANLHSCIGNAYLDLNKMPDALHHHQKDLKISKDNDNEDGKSRALDNLGRVYARIGKFDAAVEHWSQKLPLVKTPLEATWLYHEIGRCHLELGNYQDARDFGEKSFNSAQEAEDDMWQLNASVLIAQSEVKLGDLQEAIESFERSLEMAKVQGDEPAQGAISKALEELNEKIVKGLKDREDAATAAEDTETIDDNRRLEEAAMATETYHVSVKTSDDKRSGTNSNVYIILYGEEGDTGQLMLSESVAGGNKFESGDTDKFILADVRDVGAITHLKIGHDNRGAFAGWKLDSVDVEVPSLGQRLHFPCDMWLDDNEGDGKIERELKPGKKTTETYHISVKTSDERGSGTNSNVYIVLFGEEGDSGQLMLSDSVTGGNKFESGNTDQFILEGVKNVGEIQHIKIGHDNRGAFAGWKLDSVDVEVPSLGQKLHFPCDMWLDDNEGDGKIERELKPDP